jgi:hypothetical protein
MDAQLSQYAENMLIRKREDSNEFHPATGFLENGWYAVYYGRWSDSDRPDQKRTWVNGAMTVHNGIVNGFRMIPIKTIALGEALNRLGQPDAVYLTPYQDGILAMETIYFDLQIRVTLRDFRFWTGEACSILDIRNAFFVDYLNYFTKEDAAHPVKGNRHDPRIFPLLAEPGISAKLIPAETWESWLSGEVESDCSDAYNDLPEAFAVPTLPPSYAALTPAATHLAALLEVTPSPP